MTTSSLGEDWRRPAADSLSTVARDLGSLVALAVVAGTVLVTGSVRSLALALPFLLAALPTPPPVAFAAGQLAVLPTVSVEDAAAAAVAQVALLVVLVEPARTAGSAYAVAATLVASLGLAGLVVVSLPYGGLVAGGLLCLAVACGVYLARRVTLVRLGLVGDGEETGGGESAGTESAGTESDGEDPGGEDPGGEATDSPETGGDRPDDRPVTEPKE